MLYDSQSPVVALPEISLDLIAEIVRELQLLSLATVNTPTSQGSEVGVSIFASSLPEMRRENAIMASQLPVTTLMIRNIPPNMRQREVLAVFLDSFHQAELIDFFYLPTDISKKASRYSLGFCFINFATPEAASAFRRVFRGRTLLPGGFPLGISKATVQGLEENVSNVRSNSTVRRIKNPEYLPLIRVANDNGTRFVPVSSLP